MFLVRVIRKIDQIRRRLCAIETEIAQLKESELSDLKAQVEKTKEEGRDLLGEMAARLDKQIAEAREQLRNLHEEDRNGG